VCVWSLNRGEKIHTHTTSVLCHQSHGYRPDDDFNMYSREHFRNMAIMYFLFVWRSSTESSVPHLNNRTTVAHRGQWSRTYFIIWQLN